MPRFAAGCRTGLPLAAVLLLVAVCGVRAAPAGGVSPSETASSADFEIGRAIYLEGRPPSGELISARRAGGLPVKGKEAACVNCHRRSGLGAAEGPFAIPPISGPILATAGVRTPRGPRPAYDDDTLARSIREGLDARGDAMDYLMPRYDLSDGQLRALAAYLRELSSRPSPGAAPDSLRFATVLAPAADPVRSAAMVDVLRACFAERNAGPQPERGRHKLAPGMSFQKQRKWTLEVWKLQGGPETWPAQLAERVGKSPPFAMLSGIGGDTWAPLHRFCEDAAFPCLLPQVEVTIVGEGDAYSLYLSRGLLLEAGLVAGSVGEQGGEAKRVIQVLRAGDTNAAAAAQALAAALAKQGVASEQRALAAADGLAPKRALQRALRGIEPGDAVVLWLRQPDVRALAQVPPPGEAGALFVSGTLAGFERAPLPAPWKARTLMAYPQELPEKREPRMAALRRWLAANGLSPVDDAVQSDADLACRAVSNAVDEMGENLFRDYLVERLEVLMERRPSPGRYPRLSLGPDQRVASKNGYIVRFTGPAATAIEPVGERMAP